jgi:hypothetical protein
MERNIIHGSKPNHNQVQWVDVELAMFIIEEVKNNIERILKLRGEVISERFLPDIMKNVFE